MAQSKTAAMPMHIWIANYENAKFLVWKQSLMVLETKGKGVAAFPFCAIALLKSHKTEYKEQRPFPQKNIKEKKRKIKKRKKAKMVVEWTTCQFLSCSFSWSFSCLYFPIDAKISYMLPPFFLGGLRSKSLKSKMKSCYTSLLAWTCKKLLKKCPH